MIPSEIARQMPRGEWGGFNTDQRRLLRQMVWERRQFRWSWYRISTDLGITTAYAQKLAKQYVCDVHDPDRELARAEEKETLDVLQAVLTDELIKSRDPRLVDGILGVMKRRAAMLGLDEPVKTESKVSVDEGPDVDTEAILREAMATAGAPRDDEPR
jgi:hypothetical protein